MNDRSKLLVFIPAYEASRHIEWVISRIPRDLDHEFDPYILIVDDASSDGTASVARRAIERSDLPYEWTVLANPRNQGYGGNQKIGYRYAVERGFDVVVMVHGDGQYPPEFICDLAHCALEHGAAFGSRFDDERSALAGGMPRYKYVGNRILTSVQNRMLRTELTEFHSGFRAYRSDVLAAVPFELNSPDFHFDTEIFIQCARAGVDIGEFAIPTHYGDEECRVNGMRYAANVIGQTGRARLHDMGLMYERKFDIGRSDGLYEAKVEFASPTTEALKRVPPGSTVLDLGSSDGHLARALGERGCTVIGVDLQEPSDTSAFAKFITWNLDEGMPLIDADIDVVLLMDVIEHLRSPEDFVSSLSGFCQRRGVRLVLVSTGNVAFIIQRLMLLIGQFNYGPRGILDMTHTRLFTFRTIGRLFRQDGFDIGDSVGVPAPFPLAVGDTRLSRLAMKVNQLAIKVSKRMFSYQVFIEARPPIDLRDLIVQSERFSEGLSASESHSSV